MRRAILLPLTVALTALSVTVSGAGVATAAEATDAALAARWAPIHYQDTDSSDYDADYLSAVDFDGDWNAQNNWEHQDDSVAQLIGTVYYSVVETPTHWFIVYGFYHPRDWTDIWDPFGRPFEHENDMEGVLLTVRRNGTTYGKFEAMVTVSHNDFYSYTPPGSPYTDGREDIDGRVIMQFTGGVSHPTTRQEAKGHGVKAFDGNGFPGGDGVVYYPNIANPVPSSGNDRSVGYRLVDIFAPGGLWAHRNSGQTFASWGTFRGDNGANNAANAPWGWDDHDDGSDLQRGLLATHPAQLVATYFNGEGPFGWFYTRNTYR